MSVIQKPNTYILIIIFIHGQRDPSASKFWRHVKLGINNERSLIIVQMFILFVNIVEVSDIDYVGTRDPRLFQIFTFLMILKRLNINIKFLQQSMAKVFDHRERETVN